jgi:hypothetical protein
MNLKKVFLWPLSILILTLGIGLGYLYFNAQKITQNIIRNKIIKSYNESDETQYLLSLEKIKLNIWDGSIRLINVKATPKDSLVILERNLDGSTIANTSLTVHVKEIALLGFDYMEAFNERRISIDQFKINQPQIKVYQYDGISKENTIHQDTVDLRSFFLTNYDTFRINEIHLENMSMAFYKLNAQFDTINRITLEHMDYKITKVTANKETLYSSYFFEFEDYFIKTGNIRVDIANSSHIGLNSLNYNSKQEQLTLKNLQVKPRVSPRNFWKNKKFKKAWVQIDIQKIQMDSLNIKNWIATKEANISNLSVNKPKIQIFTNSRLPFNPNEKKLMLGDLIKSLPIPFSIKEADITNAVIELDIMGKNTEQHGKLRFHNMNIMAQNITNNKKHIEINKNLDVQVNTQLNQTGNIQSNLKIDLASPISSTQFNVNAKNLDLKKFTSILKPILRISIMDGNMISLKVNSTLTTHGGTGQMDAHYKNLKLQLESKELSANPGFFNTVVSGLANGVLKTENIPGEKYYHQGNFEFPKDPTDSFFKLLWFTTLYGLEDSVLGSEHRDQRRLKQQERKKSDKGKWWKKSIL